MSDFARGLSRTFIANLLAGTSAPVLAACRDAGLDVRLRQNYWNAYDAGRSVAKIAWVGGAARLEVHRKYLHADAFSGVTRSAHGEYVYVVLVRYDSRSDLLARAHRAARNLAHPIWCWLPDDDTHLRLPPPEDWVRMQ